VTKIAVITDSASDLAPDVINANSITVVALDVRLGSIPGEELQGLDPARFWSLCETTPQLPETSAPAPGAFRAALLEALDRGCSAAICVTISSRLSATNQAARAGLAELATSLSSPRCRLKSQQAVEDAAAKVIAAHGATRWVRFSVADDVEVEYRQEHRGRPGKDTRYKKVERHRFSLTFSTNDEIVRFDAASDGFFPMVTNDTTMTPAELLSAYKRQPHLVM